MRLTAWMEDPPSHREYLLFKYDLSPAPCPPRASVREGRDGLLRPDPRPACDPQTLPFCEQPCYPGKWDYCSLNRRNRTRQGKPPRNTKALKTLPETSPLSAQIALLFQFQLPKAFCRPWPKKWKDNAGQITFCRILLQCHFPM